MLAALIAAAGVARLPYLGQANLSPDAADYLNIARHLARGEGFVHSIKWHFFTSDPIVHSAVGERPPLYPLLLAPLARGSDPARPAQYLTALLALAAIALGAAWARRIALPPAAAVAGAAVLAFNPGFLICSVYPWSEPLYLCELFAVLLVVGSDAGSRRRAAAAGVLTALAFFTRPSAPAIVAALALWYLRRRAWRPLALYLATLLVLLIPWWALTWSVRGNPFYSLPKFHLVVGDIREGMAAGYGATFPGPAEFFLANAGTILAKIGRQTIAYLQMLLGPTYLALLSAFLFLRPFRGREETGREGPWVAVALFHFVLPALTWATFDGIRFMLPCFAVLVFPLAAEMERAAGGLATARARRLAWASLLGVLALLYAVQWGQQQARVRGHAPANRAMRVARWQFAPLSPPGASVATSDPFQINYWLDRPAIVLPAADSPAWPEKIERFLREYRPDSVLLGAEEANGLAPLVRNGRLAPAESIEAMGLRLFRVGRETK